MASLEDETEETLARRFPYVQRNGLAERVRGYHSVALLMPDGAVWVAGSNFNAMPGLANPRAED
jgi:hypothetical protein